MRREDFLRRLPECSEEPVSPAREIRPRGEPEARRLLFLTRLAELGVERSVCASLDEVHHSVEQLCVRRGWATIACARQHRWDLKAGAWTDDARSASFGLCRGDQAIATSGTIVLRHQGEDERGPSLLPWATGFIVHESDICDVLGEVLFDLDALAAQPAAVTFVTGPSNTADIAGVKCIGAHGPAEVFVWVLAGDDPGAASSSFA